MLTEGGKMMPGRVGNVKEEGRIILIISSLMLRGYFLSIVAPPRHCEEPRRGERGATKQSFNAIFAKMMYEIVSGDCFVAPPTWP